MSFTGNTQIIITIAVLAKQYVLKMRSIADANDHLRHDLKNSFEKHVWKAAQRTYYAEKLNALVFLIDTSFVLAYSELFAHLQYYGQLGEEPLFCKHSLRGLNTRKTKI